MKCIIKYNGNIMKPWDSTTNTKSRHRRDKRSHDIFAGRISKLRHRDHGNIALLNNSAIFLAIWGYFNELERAPTVVDPSTLAFSSHIPHIHPSFACTPFASGHPEMVSDDHPPPLFIRPYQQFETIFVNAVIMQPNTFMVDVFEL